MEKKEKDLKVKVNWFSSVQSLSHVQLFATSWTKVTRLLCPWNSPGKNIEVGSHALLQGIFPTQWWNLGLPCWGQIFYHLSHQGSLKSKKRRQIKKEEISWGFKNKKQVSTCVPTIILNKHLLETAFMDAKIVFLSFVDKETECLRILARLTLTNVTNPYIFLFHFFIKLFFHLYSFNPLLSTLPHLCGFFLLDST